MPAKNQNKGIAQGTGKAVSAGTTGRTTLRGKRQATAPAAAVIANSFHSLKLQSIPGPVVFFNGNSKDLDVEDAGEIFNAVSDAYKRLKYLVTGERVKLNFTELGLATAGTLHYMLTEIKKMLPANVQVNVDHSNDGYSVTLFMECPLDYGWHCFEVGPVIEILEKVNPRLLDCLITFLAALRKTGIGNWIDDLFYHNLYNLQDRIEEMIMTEDMGEELEELIACKEYYVNGAPATYGNQISRIKTIDIRKLQQRAQRFKSCREVANVIYQGCELLNEGLRIRDFSYEADNSYEGNYYLEIDCQFSVIWKYNDPVYCDFEECVNMIAQEGVQEPFIYKTLDKKFTLLDLENMKAKSCWPQQLSTYMERANDLLIKFKTKYEPENGSTDEKL